MEDNIRKKLEGFIKKIKIYGGEGIILEGEPPIEFYNKFSHIPDFDVRKQLALQEYRKSKSQPLVNGGQWN